MPTSVRSRFWVELRGVSLASRQRRIGRPCPMRRPKGFNAIEFRAPNGSQQDCCLPRDGAGNLPFLNKIGGGAYTGSFSETPDFTTPNEAYWSYLDTFIDYCASQGIAVLWFPAYIGYDSDSEGGATSWLRMVRPRCRELWSLRREPLQGPQEHHLDARWRQGHVREPVHVERDDGRAAFHHGAEVRHGATAHAIRGRVGEQQLRRRTSRLRLSTNAERRLLVRGQHRHLGAHGLCRFADQTHVPPGGALRRRRS